MHVHSCCNDCTFESSSAPPTEVLMTESDATIKMHKEKVQQLLSENQTLRSQLALPAPVKNLPCTFKKLEGRRSFTDQSSYGLLQLDHFSGHAVAGENIERLYTASLYYLPRSPRNTEIHLVITWDDEVHLKVNVYGCIELL